jgi:hypothetical protein
MAEKKHPTSLFILDAHKALLDQYASIRGVSRSAAMVELMMYVLDKKNCPANLLLVEEAIRAVQETL